jgi:hypothetical protein
VPEFSVSATIRNFLGPITSATARVEVRGAHHLPAAGACLIVTDQAGPAAEWIVKTTLPRPVRLIRPFLNPQDTVATPPLISQLVEDIPFESECAIDAQFEAVEVLLRGEAVGICGPMPASGFLLLASRAPLVPVAMTKGRSRVVILGEAVALPEHLQEASAASRDACAAAGEWARQHISDHHMRASRRVVANT